MEESVWNEQIQLSDEGHLQRPRETLMFRMGLKLWTEFWVEVIVGIGSVLVGGEVKIIWGYRERVVRG